MRSLIMVAALCLSACGGNQQAGNNAAVAEETDAAEVTAVNDTTAIDAATGEAANMAADVNYMFDEIDSNETSGNSTASESRNNSL